MDCFKYLLDPADRGRDPGGGNLFPGERDPGSDKGVMK